MTSSKVPAREAVVIVTGAASGIGWASARRFAAAGTRVVVADLDGARALSRAAELGEDHAGYTVDVSRPDSVHAMITRCLAEFGRLDILVNNAGRTTNGGLGLVDQPRDVFDGIFDVNYEGTMVAAEAAAKAMAERGGGSIVNVASGAAFRALPFRGSYSASKAAVVAGSQRLADAVKEQNVRVNVIAPGFVRTELLDDLIAQGRLDPSQAVSKIPLGRMGTPEDLGAAIHFVASEGSFTGAVLCVDGGSQAFGGSGAASTPVSARDETENDGAVIHLVVGNSALASALAGQLAGGSDDRVNVVVAETVTDALLDDLRTQGRLASVVDASLVGQRGTRAQLSDLHHLARKSGPALLGQGAGSFVSIVVAAEDPVGAGREAGLDMLVRTLACEWGPQGVRANSVRVPADHGNAGEVAAAVRYLVSSDAGFVNGAQLDLCRRIGQA